MKISLEGKRAFVTAGGDGMGRTTAITMAELGAVVFTCDIDPSGLETLPDSITTWQCDVGDSDALDAIFVRSSAKWSRMVAGSRVDPAAWSMWSPLRSSWSDLGTPSYVGLRRFAVQLGSFVVRWVGMSLWAWRTRQMSMRWSSGT